jgi:hypothetical protein
MKAGENLKINELEKEYKNGNRPLAFFRAFWKKEDR